MAGRERNGGRGSGNLIRTDHDPDRPVVSTGEAARRRKQSRQAVTAAVREGRLPGYGIQGADRVRWWVYADALPLPTAVESGDLDAVRRELEFVRGERDRYRARASELEALHVQQEIARENRQRAEDAADELLIKLAQQQRELTEDLVGLRRLWRAAAASEPNAISTLLAPMTVDEVVGPMNG